MLNARLNGNESNFKLDPFPLISLLGLAFSAEGGRAKVILAYREALKDSKHPSKGAHHVQTEMADREFISNRTGN